MTESSHAARITSIDLDTFFAGNVEDRAIVGFVKESESTIKEGFLAEPLNHPAIWQHLRVYTKTSGLRPDGLLFMSPNETRAQPARFPEMQPIGSVYFDGSPTEDRLYLIPRESVRKVYAESWCHRAFGAWHLDHYYAIIADKALSPRDA